MNAIIVTLLAIATSTSQSNCGTINFIVPTVWQSNSGYKIDDYVAYTTSSHLVSETDCAAFDKEVRRYCVPASKEEVTTFEAKKQQWITKHSVTITLDCLSPQPISR